MNVYTQLNKPSLDDNEQWFPCLTTVPILDHVEAKVQPLLVTHIDAVKHYQHNPGPLLDQIVHCIGPRTYDRLVDLGFTNVHMYGLKAEDIKMNSGKITEATWLHGNRYQKDFSTFDGITALQTFTTAINRESLHKLVTIAKRITSLYVYSSLVLKAFEDITNTLPGHWSHIKLHHVDSCEPTKDKWLSTTNFYPGEE